MTTGNQENISEEIEGELIEASPDAFQLDHRRASCSLDDAYIFNYTENPKEGKTAALRASGYEGEYIRQEAHRMHTRLKPKIDAVLKEKTRELRGTAYSQLDSILKSDTDKIGVANMLGAVKLAMDYADKYTPDDIVTKRPAIAEIQRRIEKLSKQISQAS